MGMVVDDGFWTGVGVTLVIFAGGVVVYKVLKKKKPAMIEKAVKSADSIREKTIQMAKGAREAFREGYESAKAKSAAGDASPAPATA